MPLKKGHSDEVRDANIKEMIDAGHPREQSVAAAYASQKKYKKMAEGGLVEDAHDFRNIEELNQDSAIMLPPDMHPDDLAIAKKLQEKYAEDDDD